MINQYNMNCMSCGAGLITRYEINGHTCRDCRKRQRRELGPAYIATTIIFALLAVNISPLFWVLAGILALSAYECLT